MQMLGGNKIDLEMKEHHVGAGVVEEVGLKKKK